MSSSATEACEVAAPVRQDVPVAPVARSPHSTSADVVGGEVVAGAPVAGGGVGRRRPSGRGRAGPGGRARRRTPPGRARPGRRPAATTRRTTSADDVGQVDQRDQRRPRRRWRPSPRARRAATRPCPRPSGRRRRPGRRARPAAAPARVGLGAEHHRHAGAAAVAQHGDRAEQPRGAVVVADQRLGRAHPGAGAGREQESVAGSPAQPRRAGAGSSAGERLRRRAARGRWVYGALKPHTSTSPLVVRGDEVAPAVLELHGGQQRLASARSAPRRSPGRSGRRRTSGWASRVTRPSSIDGDRAVEGHAAGRTAARRSAPCTGRRRPPGPGPVQLGDGRVGRLGRGRGRLGRAVRVTVAPRRRSRRRR